MQQKLLFCCVRFDKGLLYENQMLVQMCSCPPLSQSQIGRRNFLLAHALLLFPLNIQHPPNQGDNALRCWIGTPYACHLEKRS